MNPLLFGGTNGDATTTLIQWTFFILIFMFVVPKLYFYQIFSKLEASARKLEDFSVKGQRLVVNRSVKYGKRRKDSKDIMGRFVDFFMIPPVSLDPFGIMKKLEHLIDRTDERFKQVATDLSPKADEEEIMNVYMGLQASVMIHMVAKMVRHYVETVKKFKNLQIAMIIQMQLPLIEKLVEAEYKGLKTFLDGQPIGDAIGPMVIASMLKEEGKETAQDVLTKETRMWDRNLIFIKAKGPGGRLGKLGEAVEIAAKRRKITKIVTVDAAQKLEGEKTGSVAEGVGVAIGGPGVQRAKIEELATKLGIPVDAIAIKMSPFEAISPIPETVLNSIPDAQAMLEERVKDTKKGSTIIVVGVGNTCGVGNINKGLDKYIEKLKREAKKRKELEEEKKRGWLLPKKRSSEPSMVAQWIFGYNRVDMSALEKFNKERLTGIAR
jgi:hypothetical protein